MMKLRMNYEQFHMSNAGSEGRCWTIHTFQILRRYVIGYAKSSIGFFVKLGGIFTISIGKCWFWIHKLVKYLVSNHGAKRLRSVPDKLQTASALSVPELERVRLESKMREVFEEEMNKLSKDLQSALAEDIVMAFLNRIGLFIEIEAEKKRYTRTKRSLNP